MLKLKDGVTGFVYCSVHGYIKTIITQPISGKFAIAVGENDVFVDDENVNKLFEVTSQEQLEQDDERLSDVLVWIDEVYMP